MPNTENIGVAERVAESPQERKELIDLLGFEITRLEADQQRPGWTRWALVGTFASCIWLFIQQLDANLSRISWCNVFFLFFVCSFSWEVLNSVQQFLARSSNQGGRKAGFWFTQVIFSGARLVVVFKCLEKLSWLTIVWKTPFLKHDLFFWLAVSIFALSASAALIFLVISYCKHKMAFGDDKPHWPISVVNVLGSLIVGCIAARFLHTAISHIVQFSFPDLRLSLLLFAMALIIPLLLIDKIHLPFVAALLDLRRQIAMQEVTCEFGKRQAANFFKGMGTKEAFQDDVDGVLSKYRMAAASLDVVVKDAEVLIPSKESEANDSHESILAPLVREIPKRLDLVSGQLKEADEAKSTFKATISVYGWLAPSIKPELQTLFEAVEASCTATKQLVQDKIESVRDRLKASNTVLTNFNSE
ncbi:MAG TPA: hypothetical protein VG347_05450 [Verrucomicrobiae bacterium]|nr:hypothetical protein [Verrucomicrobiae bacterium]